MGGDYPWQEQAAACSCQNDWVFNYSVREKVIIINYIKD